MTAVSVVLATYNGARFLPEQLESLARQSRLPDELVVMDDGSTDGTMTLLEAFAGRAPFAVVLGQNKERLGYRANFMNAAARSRGELIFFCDQDDVWDADKIQVMTERFARRPTLAAFHNALLIDADGRSMGPTWTGDTEAGFRRDRFGSPWIASSGFTMVISRTLLAYDDLWQQSVHPGQDERLSHDHWFYFLARCLGRLTYEPRLLVQYRQHGANVVGWQKGDTGGYDQRLARRLLSGLEWQREAGRAARSRVVILGHLAARLGAEVPRPLTEMAAQLDRFASAWAANEEVHTAASAGARYATLFSSLVRGNYLRGGDLPGLPTLMRDMVVAAVGANRLRRILNGASAPFRQPARS